MSSMNGQSYYQKAKEYDLRSQYYKYTNPDLYIKYYYRHLHYMDQLLHQGAGKERTTLGKIRFFHALPSVKSIDLYINGTRIFKNVPSKSVSHYLSLPEGKYEFDLYPSGQSHSALLSRKVDIKEGTPHTIIAAAKRVGFSLFSIEDNLTLPTRETKLNCLNLNPDSAGIDIAVTGGDTIFSNLAYKKPSSYLGLTPMTVEFLLKCSRSKEMILDPFSVTLQPDQIYTMLILSSGNEHKDPEIVFI